MFDTSRRRLMGEEKNWLREPCFYLTCVVEQMQSATAGKNSAWARDPITIKGDRERLDDSIDQIGFANKIEHPFDSEIQSSLSIIDSISGGETTVEISTDQVDPFFFRSWPRETLGQNDTTDSIERTDECTVLFHSHEKWRYCFEVRSRRWFSRDVTIGACGLQKDYHNISRSPADLLIFTQVLFINCDPSVTTGEMIDPIRHSSKTLSQYSLTVAMRIPLYLS